MIQFKKFTLKQLEPGISAYRIYTGDSHATTIHRTRTLSGRTAIDERGGIMSDRPIACDLYCGAGGASMGLYRAGFEVVGIDIKPQKRYPFSFIQGDALNPPVNLRYFDFIWTSPPCQIHSITKSIHKNDKHSDYIHQTRQLLDEAGKPYCIENVPGAPLINPFTLCGSMFPGLKVYRHRLFEFYGFDILFPPATCNHKYPMRPSKGTYHTLDNDHFITCVGHNFQAKSGRIAMGIDWMTRDELSQAIPPAYSEFIGRHFLENRTNEMG